MTTTLNFDQLLEWDKYELIEQIILLQNKTYFKIQYCHNTNTYDFQILNQNNSEILYENKFTNINEINKIIQQYK